MQYKEVIKKLKSLANPKAVEGMARYGIASSNNLGVSIAFLRKFAQEIGKDHKLAQQLWASGIRDARMLACLIEDHKMVTNKQMENWAKDFDSWDICDLCCGNLFDITEFAYQKVIDWSKKNEVFIKRAGFALLAWLAVHDKKNEDEKFLKYFPIIKRGAIDDRNYVKKAVNWALRQIGKRNINLNRVAIEAAKEIQRMNSKTAKWIASDAIRELKSKKIQERLCKKAMLK